MFYFGGIFVTEPKILLFKIWLRKFFSHLKKIYHCPKLFLFHYIPKSTIKLLLLSKLYVGALTVVYFCFIDYAKAFNCVDHNKLWKLLKELGIPDHLTCLLRNLYAGQEATVRTEHGTTDYQERSMSRLHIVTLLI